MSFALRVEAGPQARTLHTRFRELRHARAVRRRSGGCRYDLVVVGTHGRRGASRAWLGSVAEEVVRASPVPVLVVRGPGAVAGTPGGFRILAAVDVWEEGVERLITEAARWGSAMHGTVDLLHAVVVPMPPDPIVTSSAAGGFQLAALLEDAEQRLARLGEQLPPEVRGTARAVWGEPASAVLQAAADHHLVVVGTHGRSGLARLWLGSIAERTVRISPAPVLVIPTRPCRPHGRSSGCGPLSTSTIRRSGSCTRSDRSAGPAEVHPIEQEQAGGAHRATEAAARPHDPLRGDVCARSSEYTRTTGYDLVAVMLRDGIALDGWRPPGGSAGSSWTTARRRVSRRTSGPQSRRGGRAGRGRASAPGREAPEGVPGVCATHAVKASKNSARNETVADGRASGNRASSVVRAGSTAFTEMWY